MEYKDFNVTLLDSPGFNDTYRSDTDVLRGISSFLSDTYSQGFHLSGILYLHPISNARMEGSSLRNLRMFRKLVGDGALSNVLLVSTHWSRVSAGEGNHREADLRNKFWKPFLDNGSTMTRHTDTAASARALLDSLVDKARVVLDIQRELVDEGMALVDTAAGSELNQELIELQVRHQEELRRVRDEMDDAIRASDERAQSELTEVRRQLEDQIAVTRRSQDKLRERERIAAREQQQLRTQIQLIHVNTNKKIKEFERSTQERETKFEAERKHWSAQVDAANRDAAEQRQRQNNVAWSTMADIANTAVNAFLTYLNMKSKS
jgi:hypothetical protein